MGDPSDWDPYIDHFSATYTCHAPDLTEPFELPATCHIVGYSMGGRIALDLLHKEPERFLSATLLSTHLGLQREEEKEQRREKERTLIEQLKEQPLQDFIQDWYNRPLFQNAPIPPSRYQQKKEKIMHTLEQFSLAKQPSFWDSYKLLKNPLLFLYGEQDLAYRQMNEHVQGTLIPNCTHAIHLQDPLSCIKQMENFYANLSTSSASLD